MFCIKCGKENPEKAKICYYCGALLVNQRPNPEAVPAKVEAEKAIIETPPLPPPAPPTAPPYYGTPPYNPNPGYNQGQPPFYGAPPAYGIPPVYGTPFQPRVPVAPNGKPYAVIENPNRFYSYTNKDGKQVYAAFANVTLRLVGAAIDTFLMTIPLLFIAPLIISLLIPGQVAITEEFANDNPELVIQAYSWIALIFGVYYLAYTVFMTARFGQTLGHRIMGIKVVKLDGTKPDLKTAFVRNLFGFSWTLSGLLNLTGIAGLTFLGLLLEFMVLIGFVAAAGSPRKQGWHDRLANTVVVHRFELVKDINF